MIQLHDYCDNADFRNDSPCSEMSHKTMSMTAHKSVAKEYRNTKKQQIQSKSFALCYIEIRNYISPPCLEVRPHKRVGGALAEVTTLTISIAHSLA